MCYTTVCHSATRSHSQSAGLLGMIMMCNAKLYTSIQAYSFTGELLLTFSHLIQNMGGHFDNAHRNVSGSNMSLQGTTY